LRQVIYIIAAMLLIGIAAWKLCCPRQDISMTLPALEQRWDEQVYTLDRDEAVRFVSPSITAGRENRFNQLFNFVTPTDRKFAHAVFDVDSSGISPIGEYVGEDTIRDAILRCAGLSELEFELPEHLPVYSTRGDWFTRDISTDRKMQALQSVLSAIAGRELIIEKRRVPREVIVVSGKWNFQEPKDRDECFSYTTAQRMLDRHIHAGNFDESLQSLQKGLKRKVINETDAPAPGQLRWISRNLWNQDRQRIDRCLISLEKQTSLKFIRTEREIPIWFLREEQASR
jgi:hypothetical protein